MTLPFVLLVLSTLVIILHGCHGDAIGWCLDSTLYFFLVILSKQNFGTWINIKCCHSFLMLYYRLKFVISCSEYSDVAAYRLSLGEDTKAINQLVCSSSFSLWLVDWIAHPIFFNTHKRFDPVWKPMSLRDVLANW